jgi:hypothetical protein
MDAADRHLIADTVRAAIDGASTRGDVDPVLAGIGWLEMLAAEPRDAVEIVFTALGAANASATALDDVVAIGLGFEPRADLAVMLPPFASIGAPAPAGANGARRAVGLATARVAVASQIIVVSDAAPGTVMRAVAIENVAARSLLGIDPSAGLRHVTIDLAGADTIALDGVTWSSAVALARRAVGHQIVGECRAMLALAREHALEREQFGQPIARFQAVRHRLADALVAIEAAESALAAAADEPVPETAALAKALAGRAARTAAAQCQQVLAGIGFTTDHAFHRHMKRTMLLDGLFGSSDEIVLDLGRQLLATGSVPMLIDL